MDSFWVELWGILKQSGPLVVLLGLLVYSLNEERKSCAKRVEDLTGDKAERLFPALLESTEARRGIRQILYKGRRHDDSRD